MELYEEIYEGLKESRCSFLPMGGGYFEGVKARIGFSDTEIILLFKNLRIVVLGEGLEIKKYCDGDLQLKGQIYSVGLEKKETI